MKTVLAKIATAALALSMGMGIGITPSFADASTGMPALFPNVSGYAGHHHRGHWRHHNRHNWGHHHYRHHRHHYRHGRYYYRDYDNDGAGIVGGLITGAIIGGIATNALSNRGGGSAHVRWCYDHYRSYRASDNTYQPYHGPRRQCVSPY